MKKKSIKFALAVDHNGHFQSKHFGDADKFLIYEWKGNELIFVQEAINPFKSLNEQHGVYKKGMAIIELLRSIGVKSLVSKQFGENIKLVNRFFIPVIIDDETPTEAILKLKNSIKWIEEEISRNTQNFKLFTLKKGTLKSIIKN